MCLTSIDSNVREEVEGEGYKVFQEHGCICSPIMGTPLRAGWQKCLGSYHIHRQYILGFHIFSDFKSAEGYVRYLQCEGHSPVLYVYKVKYKTILARGKLRETNSDIQCLDWYFDNIIVAEEMLVCEQMASYLKQ